MANLKFVLQIISKNTNEANALSEFKEGRDLYQKFKEYPKLKDLNRLI